MVQSEVWRGGWEMRYELKESNLKTFIEVVTDGGGESMSVVMNGRGESIIICQIGHIYKMMWKCRDVFYVNVIGSFS